MFSSTATLYCPPPGTGITVRVPVTTVVRTEITGRAKRRVQVRGVSTSTRAVPILSPRNVRTALRFAAFKCLLCCYGVVRRKGKKKNIRNLYYVSAFAVQCNGYFYCPPPGTGLPVRVPALTVVATDLTGRAKRRA